MESSNVVSVNTPGDERYAPDAAWRAFSAAVADLRERRVAQRGRYTLGDASDVRLLDSLACLRFDPERLADQTHALHSSGELLGRSVYARRMFEDSFQGAVIVLSACLMESRVGTLELVDSFHREAVTRLNATDRAREARPEVLDTYVCGVLRGFLGEAFNCEATATAAGNARYAVKLGDGRDANRRASS